VQNCDVKRFEELLSDDYYCSNPDGSLVDRKGFLAQTAKPVTIKGLKGENVMIRMFGDIVIIHGATAYTTADGRAARGRYTDVWRKENGNWRTISAHVTRG
jgi:ketosteroid isomerase-like protein